jgi:precorrin-4 methylase
MNAAAGRRADAGTSAGRRRASRQRAERASREVAVVATPALLLAADKHLAQQVYNLRTGRSKVYGALCHWIEELERADAPAWAVRLIGETVQAFAADVAADMEQRTVRRATTRERASGVVAHIAPSDPDPAPAGPARRLARRAA